MSEVSRGKKWSINPFQTVKVQETEYAYSSANFRNYEKKQFFIEHFSVICLQNFFFVLVKTNVASVTLLVTVSDMSNGRYFIVS